MENPSRRTLSRDTTPEAEAVQIEIYRNMPPGRKLALVAEEVYGPLEEEAS